MGGGASWRLIFGVRCSESMGKGMTVIAAQMDIFARMICCSRVRGTLQLAGFNLGAAGGAMSWLELEGVLTAQSEASS